MKRFLSLALVVIAAAFLASAASDTPTGLSPSLSPRPEIQQLQAMIAQAKAAGQIPDPAWTARIEQLQALTTGSEPAAAVAPVRPGVSKSDLLFASHATMRAERPNTPLEQQIRQLEQQLVTPSSSAPVITPALKDQLNALYMQRTENRVPVAAPARPNTPLELQIHTLEVQFANASGEEATALKQQISELYSQRPDNRTRRNSLDQGGDNCGGVTVIPSLPFSDTGTTVGYTDDFQPSCGYAAGAPDVIYQFTAIHTGPHDFSLCGSSFDTEIYVRTGGSCPGSTEIGCDDDIYNVCTTGWVLQSYLALTLTAGQTYWIIVDGYYNYSGTYSLSIRDLTGDDCSTSILIPGVPYTDYGNTSGLTDNFQPSCGYAAGAPDVVYTLNPLYTGSYTISLCGSSFDTELYVRTGGACPGTTEIACNDDACNLQSQLVVSLTAGVTYYIIVDGYYSYSGAYVLNISDDCSYPCQSYDLVECAETPSPTFGATDCDGGCNNTGDWNNPPNLFGLVLPSQTYCARGFTYDGGYRDTDWYQFNLSEPCVVQINAVSEFPLNSFILPAVCPAGAAVAQSSVEACGFMTYTTGDCIPAGDYYLWFGPNVFSGLATPRNYRFVLIESPCSGCLVDGTVLAPASVNGGTCSQGNDCSLRGSEDQTLRVNIPYESDWTFSLCGTTPNWDSYIYLTSQCCGGIIAQDDDGCGGVGVSIIRCAHLAAGTYFLTVEGWATAGCGAYTLDITECLGRCCYGGADPSCVYVNPTACQALSGIFTLGAECGPGVCYVRPSCFPTSQYSQQPLLPNEAWGGYLSDGATPYSYYDNFSGVTSPIGSIRFWGFRANWNGGNVPCGEDPMPFNIRFFQNNAGNIGPLVATFNVTLPGASGYLYGGTYPIQSYTSLLNPPVNLASGWVSITGGGDPACNFFWASANSGDGTSWFTYNNGAPTSQALDFTMCVGPACMTTDTLVINYDPSTGNNRLDFHCPQTGTYRIYSTTDHNAIYPNTFVQIAVGTVPPGHYYITDSAAPAFYKRYVIVQDCGSDSSPVVSVPFGQFVRVEPTVTPDAEQGNAGR